MQASSDPTNQLFEPNVSFRIGSPTLPHDENDETNTGRIQHLDPNGLDSLSEPPMSYAGLKTSEGSVPDFGVIEHGQPDHPPSLETRPRSPPCLANDHGQTHPYYHRSSVISLWRRSNRQMPIRLAPVPVTRELKLAAARAALVKQFMHAQPVGSATDAMETAINGTSVDRGSEGHVELREHREDGRDWIDLTDVD